MLTIKKISTKKAIMDFTSSGQDVREVTQLYFDDMLFCNSIELVEIESDTVQFLVCDHCGYVGCSPGNWLNIKKLKDKAIFCPSFELMEEGEREFSEYQPPYQLKERGVVCLDKFQFDEIRSYIPGLPMFEKLSDLNNREVSRLIQFEAPFRVLGEFPEEIKFRKELYLATTSDLEDKIISKLEELLQIMSKLNSKVQVTEVEEEEEISIFLDGSEFIEWKPIFKVNDSFYLKLEPNIGFKA